MVLQRRFTHTALHRDSLSPENNGLAVPFCGTFLAHIRPDACLPLTLKQKKKRKRKVESLSLSESFVLSESGKANFV